MSKGPPFDETGKQRVCTDKTRWKSSDLPPAPSHANEMGDSHFQGDIKITLTKLDGSKLWNTF